MGEQNQILTITFYGIRPGMNANKGIGEHLCPLIAVMECVNGVVAKLSTHHLSVTLSEAVVTDGHPLLGGAIVDVQKPFPARQSVG